MAEENSFLVAIHPLIYQGRQALAERWPDFLDILREAMGRKGLGAGDGGGDLLLFSFSHPLAALNAVLDGIAVAKEHVQWQDSQGDLPVQIVIHLENGGVTQLPVREAAAVFWDGLQPGKIYLSRPVKLRWQQLMAGRNLPPHQLEDDENGLARLDFAGDARVETERLAPDRHILLSGGHKTCFYCGLTDHPVSQCPSKFLLVETQAIGQAGYLSFAELRRIFQKIFSAPASMTALVASGIDRAEIRRNPDLCVFIAFFDVNLVYQLRFLWNSAFSQLPSWDGSGWPDRTKVDSRNLQLGLDCLRVGEYSKARTLLVKEHQVLGGKQFYANVALAFVALEQGRPKEMLQHLELAKGLADSGKEKIYISLLLSRYHELDGHFWKAEQAIQPLLNLYADCPELQYRRLQLFVMDGETTQALGLLRNLAGMDRRIFMAALLDPLLLPIEGAADDVLAGLAQEQARNARENLARARGDCGELKEWFNNEDEGLAANLTTLANLEKQYRRGSYFDLLDVVGRSRSLSASCPQLREARLDELNERVDDILIKWDGYNNFWKSYPYKFLFKNFQATLLSSKRNLVEARSRAGGNLGKSLALIDAALMAIETLKPAFYRMNRVKVFLNAFLVFAKKLLVTEVVLSALAVVLFFGITIGLASRVSSEILGLLTDPRIQKKGMFFINFFVAPLVSFAMTISAIADD